MRRSAHGRQVDGKWAGSLSLSASSLLAKGAATMETEFEFELPRGYVDANGDVHRRGTMRLATAADEILPLRDPRVQQNAGYLTIILLSRVITRLGTLSSINTRVVENLFTMDLAYLQDLYQRINMSELPSYRLQCPHCNQEIEVPLDFLLSQG
jgi:hypothetical protein